MKIARFALLWLAACTGGTSDPRGPADPIDPDWPIEPGLPGQPPEDSPMAREFGGALAGYVAFGEVEYTFDTGLHSLPQAQPLVDVDAESCSEIESAMYLMCDGDRPGCWAETTFFYVGAVPRCAARLHLGSRPDEIYAFDLRGVPLAGPPPSCGNGQIDEDEACDDGNLENFDGCDAQCEVEEFQGCEAVIEQYYRDAGIAVVSKDAWDGPRSHMMVNSTAEPLLDMHEAENCNAAIAMGTDVCNELMTTMPFVGYCESMGKHHSETGTCDVRYQVWFHAVAPESGVFTTAMTGLLGFTL